MSRNHIIYIIPHDQLLFFDHSFFHSILSFILSYLSYPWWSSSFEVDLPLSEALSSIMVSLTLGASDFIGVNLELSSLVLRNKSHPSFLFRRLYKTFPIIQMHQFHGQNYICITTNSYASCNYLTNTTFIHISQKLSRCFPSLP